MYVELILRPSRFKDQRFYSEEARRIVASALDKETVNPLLFGQITEKLPVQKGVTPLPEVPIVYNGGNGFIRIYGTGEKGAECLTREMGIIHAAVSSHLNCPVAIEIKRGMIHYQLQGYRSYRIGTLGLVKMDKPKGKGFYELWKRYLDTPEADRDTVFQEAVPMIKAELDKGLEAVANQQNIDLPRNLDIEITGGRLSVRNIHPGMNGEIGVVNGLRFTAMGDFVGPWSVGRLRGYGYGLIQYDRKSASNKEEKMPGKA